MFKEGVVKITSEDKVVYDERKQRFVWLDNLPMYMHKDVCYSHFNHVSVPDHSAATARLVHARATRLQREAAHGAETAPLHDGGDPHGAHAPRPPDGPPQL